VIKINFKLFALILVIMAILVNVTYASTTNLVISNVDVKIASKTIRDIQSGATIPEVARPGNIVEFRVEVTNNYSVAQDIRINDITVKATIEGIDNGNDLEIESDRFDLRADTGRKTIFTFDVPLEVVEDTFSVVIDAEGQDDNRTFESDVARLRLEVVKYNHLLKIIKKTLTPNPVSCSRKNIQLSTTLLNIGNFNEDSVSIEISNSDLGIDIKDLAGDIRARPNEPESRFSKAYTLKIPDDTEPGNYPIVIKAIYDDDRKVTQDTAMLSVSDCPAPKVVSKTGTTGTKEEGNVVVIAPKTGEGAQAQLPPETTSSQESFLSSNVFVASIVIAEAVAVIVGIILIVNLFRKAA